MSFAGLPAQAATPIAHASAAVIAAAAPRTRAECRRPSGSLAVIGRYRPRVFRLPVGRPVLLVVGRTGRAPGAGFSATACLPVVVVATEDVAATDSRVSSASSSVLSTDARSRPVDGLRRLSTLRVWVRTNSVRSRRLTSSGVAKKIDE